MNNSYFDKIKLLRDKTNISISLCKEALLKTEGDIEKALIYLQKYSLNNLNKKSFKKTSFGVISLNIDNIRKNAVILEVNCETDFVAKSLEFISYANNLCNFILNNKRFSNISCITQNDICLYKEIEEERLHYVLKLGENVIIKRIKKFSVDNNLLFGYLHSVNGYGKIGSILTVSENANLFADLATNIAMQVVAMNPLYLNIQSIPESSMLEFKNLLFEENINSNSLIENEKLKKIYKEKVLLEQVFIKNNDFFIKDMIFEKFNIIDFSRFEIGDIL